MIGPAGLVSADASGFVGAFASGFAAGCEGVEGIAFGLLRNTSWFCWLGADCDGASGDACCCAAKIADRANTAESRYVERERMRWIVFL